MNSTILAIAITVATVSHAGAKTSAKGLWEEAEAVRLQMQQNRETTELHLKRFNLLDQISKQFPEDELAAYSMYLEARLLDRMKRNSLNPFSATETIERAARACKVVIKSYPKATFPSVSIDGPPGELMAPYAQFALAEITGLPVEYEKVIDDFPAALDTQSGGHFPEKPQVKFADNARVHLLNLYVDWQQKGRTKDLGKARGIAQKMLKGFPNGLYVVDHYVGYTHPHALLVLASISSDNKKKTEYYQRIIKEFGGLRGGMLGTDAAFQYGPLAKHYLDEITPLPSNHSLDRPAAR